MIFAKQFAKLTWTFPAVKNAGSLHSSQRNCRNHCVQCGKRLYQIGFPKNHQQLNIMIVLCNGCCQYVYYSTVMNCRNKHLSRTVSTKLSIHFNWITIQSLKGKCLLQKYEQLQQRITALTAEYDGGTRTVQQLLRVVAYLVPEAEN
ncbi:hypothetical protein T08_5932 [Trichinella sp. T8]|nr:hypothetical protein T08_5932 [Trichinella sp. T8]